MPERLLILAPHGRDAPVIDQVLRRQGMETQICRDLSILRASLEGDVGGVFVTEEALAGSDLEALLTWCDRQPPWSDLPFVVLATKQAGYRADPASRLLERLGNVVLLERPINAETLVSASRSSIRARRRQYQARKLLEERERAEQELRRLNDILENRVEERARELDKAHEVLEFALDSAGMGSWDLDLVSGLSRRTPQHDHIFGYGEPVQHWGRDTFLAHVLDEDRPLAENALDVAIRTGRFDVECRIRRTDAVTRWIVAKGKVSFSPSGTPVRMTGVVMDTTERRVTEDALHQAQKMEAIGQLTGGVAHDFNNLLTVIVGGLELISQKPEQVGRVLRLSDAALMAAKRGEQLTTQLLAFSRRQTLRPQTVSPNRLLREFETLAHRAVGEACTLRFSLAADVHPIRIDPAQFESAVLNLIVNARDALPDGGDIVVASSNVDEPGGLTQSVAISVSDNGTGIDAHTLERAFEPFFTTKDVGKGSGLGLSQVYGFAREAGGDVKIDTEVGRGTTVTLTLPRSTEMISRDTMLNATPPAGAAREGQTVLLVEDDEQVLSMALESLSELDYRVIVARSAKEALAHVGGPERIDVMFSDVVMPGGMNGAQLAVRARQVRPDLKVVLTSGYVGAPSNDTDMDAFDILNKPYRRHELAEKIRTVLS